MRKLFLKIKRFLFKCLTGLNPEDVREIINVQNYFELHDLDNKSYHEYLKEHFNAK